MSKQSSEEKWSDLKVGIITFTALGLLIVGIGFAGGDKGLLFKKKSNINLCAS